MYHSENETKTKHILFLISSIFLCMLLSVCDRDDDNTYFSEKMKLNFDFDIDSQTWEGDFADYPFGEETFYELNYEYANLPKPLNTNLGSLKQSGNNHSDDLFMFVRKKINKLKPNTFYKICFQIEFASDVADGMVGVGGSPGEGVAIKAGAATIKPEKIISNNSMYRMNIDKGNQGDSGTDMFVIGDFSNDTNDNQYTLKTLTHSNTVKVASNSLGELWLIIGTDSGFEATTTVFYHSIKVTLEKQ